jgi:hypothetical protein
MGRFSRNSGSLNLLEASESVQVCTGIDLPLLLPLPLEVNRPTLFGFVDMLKYLRN